VPPDRQYPSTGSVSFFMVDHTTGANADCTRGAREGQRRGGQGRGGQGDNIFQKKMERKHTAEGTNTK
jgi:hypothetical protein